MKIRLTWEYDAMFSAAIIGDYDKDSDFELNTAECEEIKKNIFVRMKEYNYYTEIYSGKDRIFPAPEFEASSKDGILKFRFFYTISKDKLIKDDFIKIRVFDEENYTAFKLAYYARNDKTRKFLIEEGEWDEDILKIPVD
jgi:ABC-type uncharacterized transport system substrate-binding protein